MNLSLALGEYHAVLRIGEKLRTSERSPSAGLIPSTLGNRRVPGQAAVKATISEGQEHATVGNEYLFGQGLGSRMGRPIGGILRG